MRCLADAVTGPYDTRLHTGRRVKRRGACTARGAEDILFRDGPDRRAPREPHPNRRRSKSRPNEGVSLDITSLTSGPLACLSRRLLVPLFLGMAMVSACFAADFPAPPVPRGGQLRSAAGEVIEPDALARSPVTSINAQRPVRFALMAKGHNVLVPKVPLRHASLGSSCFRIPGRAARPADASGSLREPRREGGPSRRANQLFVTGDSVDLQLGTDPAANLKRAEAAVGDLRLLISVFEGKPVAVLYRWKVAGKKSPVTFSCSWRSCTVDGVEVVRDAKINITRRGGGYTVEAAVPLAALGFAPQAGKEYKIDLGVIYSDAKGDNPAARVYWANQATGLTADVPGEIMATPNLWGTATLGP